MLIFNIFLSALYPGSGKEGINFGAVGGGWGGGGAVSYIPAGGPPDEPFYPQVSIPPSPSPSLSRQFPACHSLTQTPHTHTHTPTHPPTHTLTLQSEKSSLILVHIPSS